MNKTQEALKLALEAIEACLSAGTEAEDQDASDKLCDARAAIREALAEQPAQQEVDWEKLYRLEVKKKEALAAKYERDTGKTLTRIVPMAKQPARQQEPVCEWQPEDDEHMPGTWRSDCGVLWTFTVDGPKENDMRFCCGCGAKLREKNA